MSYEENITNPRTIEELQLWYMYHNLPPANITRFFIGIDYKEPRAYGIYKQGEQVIVYKNKDDGTRAIRYEGTDEAYAVNEIWLKLKERIAEEKEKNHPRKVYLDPSESYDLNAIKSYNPDNYRDSDYSSSGYSYSGSGGDSGGGAIGGIIGTIVAVILGLLFGFGSFDGSSSSGSSYSDHHSYHSSYSDSYSSDSYWDSGDTWDSGGGDWSSDW